MIKTLMLAFKDVFSKEIRWLVVASFLISVAFFIAAALCFHWAAREFIRFDSGFLSGAVEVAGMIGLFVGALFLFPAVMPMIAGFLIDSEIERLSGGKAVLRTVPFKENLLFSGGSALRGAAASILLIPASVLTGWIPVLNMLPFALYLYVNGAVLGREYFFAVALRFSDYEKAREDYEKRKPYWTLAGTIVAALMLVPFVNMLSPLIAAAFVRRLYTEERVAE